MDQPNVSLDFDDLHHSFSMAITALWAFKPCFRSFFEKELRETISRLESFKTLTTAMQLFVEENLLDAESTNDPASLLQRD